VYGTIQRHFPGYRPGCQVTKSRDTRASREAGLDALGAASGAAEAATV
jgi:hypothetical protein